MEFDFSFFTEIPGILVTVGVVFLLIALVLLIVTGKKSKKDVNKQEIIDEKKAKKED